MAKSTRSKRTLEQPTKRNSRATVSGPSEPRRHCKPILATGSGQDLLKKAGIPLALPDGAPDPGLIITTSGDIDEDGFVAALAKHRHFQRETDPPRV